MPIPRLFTVDEVAAATRAPRSSVLSWIYTGKLRSKKVGRRQLVDEATLLAFIGCSDVEAEEEESDDGNATRRRAPISSRSE